MNNLPEGAKLVATTKTDHGELVKVYQLPSEVHFVNVNGVLVFDEEENEDDIT